MAEMYTLVDPKTARAVLEQSALYVMTKQDYILPPSSIYYEFHEPISLPASSLGVPATLCVAEIGDYMDQHSETEFMRLADTWKKQTGHLSNINTRCTHAAYQQIIGMGKVAIRFILHDLKKTQDDWFWALTAITGENPIPKRDAGYVKKMTEAWLLWGKARGYDV